jgi:hypothetical protein
MNIKKDDLIERTHGNHKDIGARGTIVDTNERTQRARVLWTHSRIRTWIKVTSIKKIEDGKTDNKATGAANFGIAL